MAIFPTSFIFFHIGQENAFYDILEKKTCFLAIETRSSKSRKIDIIPKGLTHGFGPKNGQVSNFFLGTKGQGNVFYDILKRKSTFLGYKSKNLKKSNN